MPGRQDRKSTRIHDPRSLRPNLCAKVGPEITLALEGRDCKFFVGGLDEPIGIYEGRLGHSGAGYGDVAFAEGRGASRSLS